MRTLALTDESLAWSELYAPLAPGTPDEMYQMQVVCYVYFATLTAYAWDWVLSLKEEYEGFQKGGWHLPNLVYLVSRVGTLGYCISVLFEGMSAGTYGKPLFWTSWMFWELSALGTYVLFFIRVRAIYENSTRITTFFGVLCIAIIVSPIGFLLGIKGDHITRTLRFSEVPAPFYGGVATIIPAINDTLIFFTISYRLVLNSVHGNTWQDRMRVFSNGDGLRSLSKALLTSGQIYYGVTIVISIATSVLLLSSSVPGVYSSLLGPAYIAISSAMACRAYLTVLLCSIDDEDLDTSRIKSAFRAGDADSMNPADTLVDSQI